jgi:hypothetical protein
LIDKTLPESDSTQPLNLSTFKPLNPYRWPLAEELPKYDDVHITERRTFNFVPRTSDDRWQMIDDRKNVLNRWPLIVGRWREECSNDEYVSF